MPISNTYPVDPCLDPERPLKGRMSWASPLHKKIRAAKTSEKLDEMMDVARSGSPDDWNTAMAAVLYRSSQSSLHMDWLVQALKSGTAGPAPDAWGEAWMRGQFLGHVFEHKPEVFDMILDQWPEIVAWDIYRSDARCSMLLTAGYKGQLYAARRLLESFDDLIERTLQTNENPLGRLMFNGFMKQDDPSWLLLLNEFDPGLLYRTSEGNETSMIEMLAERHKDKSLDKVLEVSNIHDPMQRHGLHLVHFAAKGIKSSKMDRNTGQMRSLEVEEMMVLAEGFARTAAVLAKHGHDIEAKALKKHESTGKRPRGYPLPGSSVAAYFLKRNKAGSLPTEVLASVNSTIMRLTVAQPAEASAPRRAARL